jgi:hypothetical protein
VYVFFQTPQQNLVLPQLIQKSRFYPNSAKKRGYTPTLQDNLYLPHFYAEQKQRVKIVLQKIITPKRVEMKKKEYSLSGFVFLSIPLAFFVGVVYLIIYLL